MVADRSSPVKSGKSRIDRLTWLNIFQIIIIILYQVDAQYVDDKIMEVVPYLINKK